MGFTTDSTEESNLVGESDGEGDAGDDEDGQDVGVGESLTMVIPWEFEELDDFGMDGSLFAMWGLNWIICLALRLERDWRLVKL
ncbi:unnamed protein product [Linum trigynum]|uniref:Uncharacterized protein n=1 Tax=Linum trigynum TaxID=586398 RepID=A0AAV2ECL9_9ROSI